ncbi:MAG: hypothetical protein V4772_15635, partial [Pseudomonadota bacterium]
VYISYTQADSILAAATVVDKDLKLGTNPGMELILSPKVRYIDFEGAAGMRVFAHRYFVADPDEELSKHSSALFGNLMNSKDDFLAGASEKTVYPVGCRNDGSICYMGNGSANPLYAGN